MITTLATRIALALALLAKRAVRNMNCNLMAAPMRREPIS